jgi:A/G-specific adenine glycosylase
LCAANAAGLQHSIPVAKPPKIYTQLREAAVIVRKNGSVLVRQCAQGERWAGLWDFPRFALEADGSLFAQNEIAEKVEAQTGIKCRPTSVLKTMKHGVTRYRITLDCYAATYIGGRVRRERTAPVRWQRVTSLGELPLSTTGRQISNMLTR